MNPSKILFNKRGQFSKTSYLLVVWFHLVFLKFIFGGTEIPYLGKISGDFPKGWVEITQILAMLYCVVHNFSFHMAPASGALGAAAGAVLDRIAGGNPASVTASVTASVDEASAFPKGKEGV